MMCDLPEQLWIERVRIAGCCGEHLGVPAEGQDELGRRLVHEPRQQAAGRIVVEGADIVNEARNEQDVGVEYVLGRPRHAVVAMLGIERCHEPLGRRESQEVRRIELGGIVPAPFQRMGDLRQRPLEDT